MCAAIVMRFDIGTIVMIEEMRFDIVTIVIIEEMTVQAESFFVRCVAGSFSLLACSSRRAADALRTRSLRLTPGFV